MVRKFHNNFTKADPNCLDYSIGNGGSIYGIVQRSPGCLLGDVETQVGRAAAESMVRRPQLCSYLQGVGGAPLPTRTPPRRTRAACRFPPAERIGCRPFGNQQSDAQTCAQTTLPRHEHPRALEIDASPRTRLGAPRGLPAVPEIAQSVQAHRRSVPNTMATPSPGWHNSSTLSATCQVLHPSNELLRSPLPRRADQNLHDTQLQSLQQFYLTNDRWQAICPSRDAHRPSHGPRRPYQPEWLSI